MPSYKAPLDDMRFVLNEVLNVSQLRSPPDFENVDDATINEFLAQTARLAEEVLFPLNASGDREGCHHDRDTKTVATPKGFKEAYAQFCAAGLPGFACDPKYGGLGMPIVLNTALSEMFCSANMAFAMYPGLSHGAYNALHVYGTEEQKNAYLPKLVSGEWSGTMCLTEPQCGTDLGLIKTLAVKQADGSYQITGTKIFISSGEHDLTSNILHLVLARIDDPSTPPGIKGISLFLVPKIMQDGARNGVWCQRIEEKMGIHGNSTCEVGLENAYGTLIGEPHKGMRAMFVMMNEARLGVGLQGLSLSEIAYQNALIYALDRRQGQPIEQKIGEDNLGKSAVPIITHPDVRRELLTVKAQAEAARMMIYWVSMQLDIAHKHADEKVRRQAQKIADLLTPIMKAHFTDNAVDNTNSAMQVFGGHGYIKEHGMEQYNRDARITRLYEGTNGIQALDLIGRKVMKENLLGNYLSVINHDMIAALKAGVSLRLLCRLAKGSWCRLWFHTFWLRLKAATGLALAKMGHQKCLAKVMVQAGAMSTDYLKLFSTVAMGHMWVKMATVAKQRLAENPDGRDFYETKLKTARFYFDRIMPQTAAYSRAICRGAESTMDIAPESFAHQQTTIGEKSWTKPETPAKA
ncbi:MAG TPA: acyl-CoA dehydrogenase C-terminal domain-containing protein [Patescibacteria group bacterium]|nr:acyl-CoA dehydrogenase C-terminal domain-containing protein [Patescibacteria group bacterium]